jgi:nitrite reductase/ring-hydroxylating ferredoxin subunit
MTWRATGIAVDAFPVGTLREVTVGGDALVLARTAAGVFALDAYCPHAGGVLAEGWLEGERLVCPVHQAGFGVSDGRVLADPFSIEPPQGGVEPVGHYPTRVTAGMLEVDLP